MLISYLLFILSVTDAAPIVRKPEPENPSVAESTISASPSMGLPKGLKMLQLKLKMRGAGSLHQTF